MGYKNYPPHSPVFDDSKNVQYITIINVFNSQSHVVPSPLCPFSVQRFFSRQCMSVFLPQGHDALQHPVETQAISSYEIPTKVQE